MLKFLNQSNRVEPTLNVSLVDSDQLPHEDNASPTIANAVAPSVVGPTLVVLPRTEDNSEPTSPENRHCYVVRYVKFKPGVAYEARQIISEHFWPIDRALHRKMLLFDFPLGEWDHMVYVQLDDAPSQFDWLPGPLTTRWLEHFHEREGGKENAEAISGRYNELVARSKTELAIATF